MNQSEPHAAELFRPLADLAEQAGFCTRLLRVSRRPSRFYHAGFRLDCWVSTSSGAADCGQPSQHAIPTLVFNLGGTPEQFVLGLLYGHQFLAPPLEGRGWLSLLGGMGLPRSQALGWSALPADVKKYQVRAFDVFISSPLETRSAGMALPRPRGWRIEHSETLTWMTKFTEVALLSWPTHQMEKGAMTLQIPVTEKLDEATQQELEDILRSMRARVVPWDGIRQVSWKDTARAVSTGERPLLASE